jgi:hypothetical protein
LPSLLAERDTRISVSDDLVPDHAGIAQHLFKADSPQTVRKVRNLIARHNLPVVKRGRYIWSFRSQLYRFARGETVQAGSGR